MADLLLYGNTQTNVNAQPITAGQLLYTTDLTHNKQYLDKDASTRVEIGGMDLITSEVDFNAQTASTDKALDSFVLKEILDGMGSGGTVINDSESNPIETTNLIDTLTGVVSNTNSNQVAGALAVKELKEYLEEDTTMVLIRSKTTTTYSATVEDYSPYKKIMICVGATTATDYRYNPVVMTPAEFKTLFATTSNVLAISTGTYGGQCYYNPSDDTTNMKASSLAGSMLLIYGIY